MYRLCTIFTLLAILLFFMPLNGCGGGGGGGGSVGTSSGGSTDGGGGGTIEPAPIVTSCTNAQEGAELTVGQEIVIRGSNFGGTRSTRDNNQSYVSFCAETGGGCVTVENFVSWGPNEIRCYIPGLTPGENYVVIVTRVTDTGALNSSSTGTGENTIAVSTPAVPPAITGINPETVSSGGFITITGTNFGATSDGGSYVGYCNVGDCVIVTTCSFWSDTQIICTVPFSCGTGVVQVYVHTEAGGNSSESQVTVGGG